MALGSPNSNNSSNNQVQQPNRGFRRTEVHHPNNHLIHLLEMMDSEILVVSVEEAAHLVAE